MSNLRALSILVTRPESPGKMLCEQITTLGATAIHLPTIAFTATDNPAPPLEPYQWIIFVSQQAVVYALPAMLGQVHSDSKIAAVGEATAEALLAAGFDHIVYPTQQWTSEGLLDLPVFQHITGQKILLVRGEGGREFLADVLQERGAWVDHWVVYRRFMPVCPDIALYRNLLRQKKIDIIVCASGESLHNLVTIIGEDDKQALQQVPLIVVSQRLAALAESHYFQHIFVAKNASHAAVIEAACLIKGKMYARE